MSNHDQERLAVFAQILREQTSASSRSQQQRLATALTTLGNITTIEAREFLNVMHPSGRINELRNQGWGIEPPRVRYVDDCGVVHSIANYILKSLPVRSAA